MSRSDKETGVTMIFQDIDKISPQITTITLSSKVQIAVFLFHNDESTIHSSLPDRGRELFCRGINTFPHWVSERVSTVAVVVRRSAVRRLRRGQKPSPHTATWDGYRRCARLFCGSTAGSARGEDKTAKMASYLEVFHSRLYVGPSTPEMQYRKRNHSGKC